MKSITARNVNHAFMDAWHYLAVAGVKETSRNGEVLAVPGPVCTTFTHPQERVLFNPKRDANPVFHLMEAIWCMAGEAGVAWLSQFNSRYVEYAEPNGFVHGAYGRRWFDWWGVDQVFRVILTLKENKDSKL